MRVMILVPGLPLNMDNIKGGVHSAVANLLKGFAGKDVDVRVVSFNKELKQEVRKDITDRIQIVYAAEGSFPFHSVNYLIHGPGIVKKHIREFKPDVIHYEEGSSFLLSKISGLKGIKYLLTIHGMNFAEAKRKKKLKDKLTWYFNGLFQVSMMPKNVIHLSEFSRRLFSSKKINYAIIPNAIVPQYFNVPSKLQTSNSLLYMGVIDNNKNLVHQLYALKALVEKGKPFTLDVLGDFISDEYRQLIHDYVKENNLQPYVRFNGWVPQPVVLQFIEKTDILVVSSRHESLPMVIAESMAAGKVVVASTVGGIPEMITDKINGYLYDLAVPGSLESILETLYNNNELVQQVSSQAKTHAAATYQCDNIAAKTISFYQTLV
jgi:glycosyltransferase involved in cell wall biosynthesis